jgi:hypothetical protein
MPNLDMLLADTMLGAGAPHPRWRHSWSPFSEIVKDPAPKAVSHDSGHANSNVGLGEDLLLGPLADRVAAGGLLDKDQSDIYENNPIWSFDSPAFAGAAVRVANVNCKVRSMGYMRMKVLDSIEWGPVAISSDKLGRVDLPLTETFLLRSRYVKDGSIKISDSTVAQQVVGVARALNTANNDYWLLPAKLDQSFEMVFGYELLPGLKNPLSPLIPADYDSEHFMQQPGSAVFHTDPGKPPVSTLRTPPLQVIVVVSLVCCKERYDFVKGNVLGTGRIYPLVMVVANSPLQYAAGSVALARPSKTAMTGIMGETMTSEIGSAFFTDRNDASFNPIAWWSNIFDYYYLDPPAAKYKVVTPSDSGRRRRISNGITETTLELDGKRSSAWRDVIKLAGQGEFDNFHIAPKMVDLDPNPGLTGLDKITMAPFCVHDCFHMHVRWGDEATDIYNRGWVGQTPYAEAGAPLVPGNQEVSIEVLSPVSFRYTATAQRPSPGQWQIVMHHGAAYALSFNADAVAAVELVQSISKVNWRDIAGSVVSPVGSQPLTGVAGGRWTTFYWLLRYGQDNAGQFERITWTPQQFAALRELAAPQTAAAHAT